MVENYNKIRHWLTLNSKGALLTFAKSWKPGTSKQDEACVRVYFIESLVQHRNQSTKRACLPGPWFYSPDTLCILSYIPFTRLPSPKKATLLVGFLLRVSLQVAQ